jgi:hypothetical protein
MTKARDLSKLLSTANGKIAGANLDVSFENITDTGTEGTRVATGTTGQRGSTAGQLRFNTTTGLAEYYTGTEFKAIDTPPAIVSVDVTNIETDLGGTQTFVITGTLFNAGATVKFKDNGGTEITPDTTTVNSSSQITVTKTRSSFSNANEPYDIIVTNPSGLSATLDDYINVDNSPSWSTASGSLGNVFEGDTANFSVSATDPDGDTVAYSETGGTVLSTNGLSINSSTGAITGTAGTVSDDTTINFDLRATANSKNADRSFSILIKDSLETNANTLAFFDFASGRSYDGTSTLQDLTSRNKDLPIGTAQYVNENGGVLDMNGSGSTRTTGLVGSVSEISMGVWVKLDGNTNKGVMAYGDTSGGNHFFMRDGIDGTPYNFQIGKDISGQDNWWRLYYNGSDISNYITGVNDYANKYWFVVVRVSSGGILSSSLNGSNFETRTTGVVNMSGHSAGAFGLGCDFHDDNHSYHKIGVAFWYQGLITQSLTNKLFERYATRFGY